MNLEGIAKRAGVSRSTVSRVVNNDPNVSSAVRARVQAIIDDVGYKPHAAARALASHRSRAIGLVVPEDFSRYHVDIWYPLIIEATLAAARDAGLALFLIMEDTFSPGAGRRVIDQFVSTGRVEGLLVLMHSYDDHLTPALLAANVPTVLLAESNIPGAIWVDNDNFASGRQIGELVRQSGASNPVIITGAIDHVPSMRRAEGFREVFPRARQIVCPFSLVDAQDIVRQALEGHPRPDAVFAVNGWLAPLVCRAAEDLGMAIPDDLVVVTFDEFDPRLNDVLGLTSGVQQTSTLADTAVHVLTELIEGRSPPSTSAVLETSIVTRGSCREHMLAASQGGGVLGE